MDLVLDSSFLIASKLEKDKHHKRTRAILEQMKAGAWEHLILCDHVLAETLTVVQAKTDKETAAGFAKELMDAAQVTFLVAGDDIFDALQIFDDEQNGDMSLVDCLLVHLTRSFNAHLATFDGGFESMRGVEVVAG